MDKNWNNENSEPKRRLGGAFNPPPILSGEWRKEFDWKRRGRLWLLDAALENDVERLRELLSWVSEGDARVSLEQFNQWARPTPGAPFIDFEEGDTPLICAARLGRAEAVEALLEREPHERAARVNRGGKTAFMAAVERGRANTARLLAPFSDLRAQCAGGFNALMLGAKNYAPGTGGGALSVAASDDAGHDVNAEGRSALIVFCERLRFLSGVGAPEMEAAKALLTVSDTGLAVQRSGWSKNANEGDIREWSDSTSALSASLSGRANPVAPLVWAASPLALKAEWLTQSRVASWATFEEQFSWEPDATLPELMDRVVDARRKNSERLTMGEVVERLAETAPIALGRWLAAVEARELQKTLGWSRAPKQELEKKQVAPLENRLSWPNEAVENSRERSVSGKHEGNRNDSLSLDQSLAGAKKSPPRL